MHRLWVLSAQVNYGGGYYGGSDYDSG